jgi:DNA-binding NarL/FixJ family response regulator
MLGWTRRSPFVGREAELGRIREAFAAACLGDGALVLVAGEPGIGKTRLIEEGTAGVRRRGVPVLWGRCYEGEGAPAFWPWVQLIRAYAQRHPPPTLREVMGAGAADIAQVVPEVRQRLPDLPFQPALEPEQARFRFFDAVTAFLKRAAAAQPLVLVLDDLHWADRPSLLLLEFLARELEGARLLVLGAYRDVELDRTHPLGATLAALQRERTYERTHLRGLSTDEVVQLLELGVGHELDVPGRLLARTLQGETEGNPFFLEETLRHLAEAGRLVERGGRWVVAAGSMNDLGLPEGVREVIGRRLQRLSKSCDHLLTLAAVVGREFDVRTLERASRYDSTGQRGGSDVVLQALAEAETARLVEAVPEAPGRYRFAHALIRETLYRELSTARRVRLHRRVGETLERQYGANPQPHLSELAYHFIEGAPGGDVQKAVTYVRRAGDRALALLAYEEAATHYRRALRVLDLAAEPDPAQRCALLLALGEAHFRSSDIPNMQAAYRRAGEVARELDAPELLARAAVGFAQASYYDFSGRHAEAQISLLKEARRALGNSDSALKALVLGHLARVRIPIAPADEVLPIAREALAMGRRAGDLATLPSLYMVVHQAMHTPANAEERLALLAECLRVSEQIGGSLWVVWARMWRCVAFLELGDIEALDAEADLFLRAADELRVPSYRNGVTLLQATRSLLHGHFAEGVQQASQALEIAERLQGLVELPLVARFFLRRELDKHAQDEPWLRERIATSSNERLTLVPRCMLAALYADLGRSEEALRIFEALAADDFAHLPWGFGSGRLFAVALLAELSARFGDAQRSAVLYDLLFPYAARNVCYADVATVGAAERYLGLLAAATERWDAARRHFEAALAFNARMAARPWLAWTEYDYAAMLMHRGAPGDLHEARQLLDRALAFAHELGMKRLVRRAERTQTELGARERPSRRHGRTVGHPGIPGLHGLSGRELEVLRLIAAGRTNQEIANALTLSVRTVERHAENLYAKIGARGRLDAAAYALRHGLADRSGEG